MGEATLNLARVDWTRVLIVELAILAGLVLLFVAGQVVGHVSHFLGLVGTSAVVAFLVAPIVGRLHRGFGNRLVATALVYVGVLIAVSISLALLAGPLIREALAFARELPRYAELVPDWAHSLEAFAAGWGVTIQVAELAKQATAQLQAAGSLVLGGTMAAAGGVSSALADVVLTLVMSFYLSVDGPGLRERLHRWLPARYLPPLERLEASMRRVFGGYVRGQFILGVTIGLLAGVGAAVLGLPYPIVLGVLAGVFELVPMFGSLLGAVPALIAALFMPFPTLLWVGLYFLAINQAENYLLAPRITGESLGLSPLGALLALLLGVELAGFLGALVAVPVAAVLVDLSRSSVNAAAATEPAAS